MQPQNTLQKKIGIAAAVFVICALGAVVAVEEMKAPPAPISDTATAAIPDATNGIPAASGATPPLSQVPPVTDQTSSNGQPMMSSAPPPADMPNRTASVYKDGTYSATGSYMSPGGPDQVGVSLTLKNDIITDITVTAEPGDNESARYQSRFVSGYKQLVIGKNIADVHLTRVSGSSLTSIGFNDALAQIKARAKA